MFKPGKIIGVLVWLCTFAGLLQAQCPGFVPLHNTNLACAIATTAPSQSKAPDLSTAVGATMATQLTQLPIATAVSGAGLVFDPAIGTWKVSEDLGPVLTQRGETIGRNVKFLSFSYQRFAFDSIDGIDLKHFQLVNPANGTIYAVNDMRVDFRVDQFVALGTIGVSNRVDLSLAVPFSVVILKSQRAAGTVTGGTVSGSVQYTAAGNTLGSPVPLQPNYFPGSASGIGDVIAGVKANVFRSQKETTAVALGAQVRFPTGDAENYLGGGAYGFRPYVVVSRRGRRVTPNATLAYQWNSASILNQNASGAHLSLPGSVAYSGGADIGVVKRLSVSAEFLGQYVINGPRLRLGTTGPNNELATTVKTLGSYAMNNAAIGFKANPFSGLYVSASFMFKLDDPGLRANVVPFVGIAYRF